MKKRHAWIWMISGLVLIIVAAPIPISWIYRMNIESDPRPHYLDGLGQIAGFFGMAQTKSDLTYKAHMISKDLVEVEVEFATLEEKNEVLDNLMFTNKIRKVGLYYSPGDGPNTKCTFQVKSSAEQDFREAIKEAHGIKEAREAAQAREAEEAIERAQRKRTWSMTPRPLPVAPRNLQMPRIEEANPEFKSEVQHNIN